MTHGLRSCIALLTRMQSSCTSAQRVFGSMAATVRSAERGLGVIPSLAVPPASTAAARTAERRRSAAALTAVRRRTKTRPSEVLRRARRQVQRRPHPDPEPA